MAPKSTPPKSSAPALEQRFKIFCDDRTPRHFALLVSNAHFDNSDDENSPSAPTFKFVDKSTTTKAEPAAVSVKRAPLTDVTRGASSRPRSLSAAFAEIAQLKDELEASEDQNRELKGEIVAYQDALYQADVDTCP